MQQSIATTISENLDRIRSIVRDCSTESVVRWCIGLPALDNFFGHGLSSPAKQLALLLGVLLESPEPAAPREFGQQDQVKVTRLLEDVFLAYMQQYHPQEGQLSEQANEWFEKRIVTMQAFISYFFQMTLTTYEQAVARMQAYFVPYDAQLSEGLGLSASDALAVADWIPSTLRGRAERGDFPGIPSYKLPALQRQELLTAFGDKGQAFWNLFTIGRGEGTPVEYPTERSIVESRPLIRLSDELAVSHPANRVLLSAMLSFAEHLENSSARTSFLRHRDKTLEDQTERAFRQMLGPNARVFTNLYETPDNHNEHDLIIFTDDICLFVECKATPPVEPFRDPEKAYIRLRRAFPF